MKAKNFYYPSGEIYCCEIHEDKLLKKEEGGKIIYNKSNETEKTTIFCYYNNKELDKIHVENHKQLKFSHEFKIINDKNYTYKINETEIKGQNIEKLLKELENDDNSISMLFIHKILEKCREIEK